MSGLDPNRPSGKTLAEYDKLAKAAKTAASNPGGNPPHNPGPPGGNSSDGSDGSDGNDDSDPEYRPPVIDIYNPWWTILLLFIIIALNLYTVYLLKTEFFCIKRGSYLLSGFLGLFLVVFKTLTELI
jgi:hypothetical protein